jgi:hypothetical protein
MVVMLSVVAYVTSLSYHLAVHHSENTKSMTRKHRKGGGGGGGGGVKIY